MDLLKAYEALLAGKKVTRGGAGCTLDEGSMEMQIPHAEMACSYTVRIPARLFKDDAFEVVEEHPELKPCPICGGKGGMKGSKPVWVICRQCKITTMDFDNSEQAAKEWNTRVHDTKERQEPGYVDCLIYAKDNWLFFDIPDDVSELDLRMAGDHVGFIGYVYRGSSEDVLSLSPRRCLSECNNEAVTPVAVRIKKGGA